MLKMKGITTIGYYRINSSFATDYVLVLPATLSGLQGSTSEDFA